jgi:signal peptide peptidase SppA
MVDLVERILSQPWAIDSDYAISYGQGIANLLAGKQAFPALSKSEWKARNKTLLVYLDQDDTTTDDDHVDDDGNDDLVDPDVEDDESTDAPEPISTGAVAVFRLRGPVLKYSQFCGPRGTLDLSAEVDKMANDPNIVGAVFHCESGGGEFYAVRPLTEAFKRFKAKKPLVTLAGDYLCSAAYYLAVYTEEIFFEHPKAVIGSIGTKISFMDMKPVWEKMGVKFHDINATASSLKNKTTNEALKGNYKPILDKMLNPINDDFIGDVKEQRGKNLSNNKTILQGETFFGTVAQSLGMVDTMGTLNDAVARVRQLAATSRTQNKTPQNSIDMKFTKVESLAGIAKPTAEQLEGANAELTEAGITGATLVDDGLIQNAAEVTTANATLTTEVATLTTAKTKVEGELATSKTALTAAESKIVTLEAQVEAFGKNAGANHKSEAGKDTNAADPDADFQAVLDAMPHNQSADKMLGGFVK